MPNRQRPVNIDAEKNRYSLGHPEALAGFRTSPAPTVRPFMAPTHPEMPGGPLNVHMLRRELRAANPSADAVSFASRMFRFMGNHGMAGQLETEARRMGIL